MDHTYIDTISGEELYMYIDPFDGDQMYYHPHYKWVLHRVDGPALVKNGSKVWYRNGKLHRVDGPGKERASGYRAWYINGVFIFSVDKGGAVIGRMS